MWISKKEYNAMKTRLAYLENRDSDQRSTIRNLEFENHLLSTELSKYKNPIYYIDIILTNDKVISYNISAAESKEAYNTAINKFFKDNRDFSSEDIKMIVCKGAIK